MEAHHDLKYAGHPGIEKTKELITRNYWWPAIKQDVHQYVTTCVVCQRTKTYPSKPVGFLQPNRIPTAPWEDISLETLSLFDWGKREGKSKSKCRKQLTLSLQSSLREKDKLFHTLCLKGKLNQNLKKTLHHKKDFKTRQKINFTSLFSFSKKQDTLNTLLS